jgi:hypothetical protein
VPDLNIEYEFGERVAELVDEIQSYSRLLKDFFKKPVDLTEFRLNLHNVMRNNFFDWIQLHTE